MPLRCSRKWRDNCQCKKVFYEKDAVALVLWKVVRVASNFRRSSYCQMLRTACNWHVQNSTLCQAVAKIDVIGEKRNKKILMQLYKPKHSDLQGYAFTSLWFKLLVLQIKRNRNQPQLKINFAHVSLRIYFSVGKTTFWLTKSYTE